MKKLLVLQEKQDKFTVEMNKKFEELKESYEIKEEKHYKEYAQLQLMREQYQQVYNYNIVINRSGIHI